MKKLLRFGYIALAESFLAITTSCEENEELIPDEEDVFAAEMILEEGMGDVTKTVYISDFNPDSTSFDVSVTFKSTNKKMRRVYMTENIAGAGIEPYELLLDGLDKKGDGSLDVESKQGNEFTFKLPFSILSTLSAGTVEYQIWATSGKGDYRDTSNSVVTGVGTLIVNYGGVNPTTQIKEYTAKIFAAPLSDGSSESFISLLDGKLYKINEGEEFVAFWDFGYYYGSKGKASLSSTFDYPTTVIDIPDVASTSKDVLNKTFFSLSTKTATDFDAVTSSAQLDNIEPSTDGTITNLAVGNIIEFVDNYGKKGLIEVEEIKGTWNSGDYITLNIKVQP